MLFSVQQNTVSIILLAEYCRNKVHACYDVKSYASPRLAIQPLLLKWMFALFKNQCISTAQPQTQSPGAIYYSEWEYNFATAVQPIYSLTLTWHWQMLWQQDAVTVCIIKSYVVWVGMLYKLVRFMNELVHHTYQLRTSCNSYVKLVCCK